MHRAGTHHHLAARRQLRRQPLACKRNRVAGRHAQLRIGDEGGQHCSAVGALGAFCSTPGQPPCHACSLQHNPTLTTIAPAGPSRENSTPRAVGLPPALSMCTRVTEAPVSTCGEREKGRQCGVAQHASKLRRLHQQHSYPPASSKGRAGHSKRSVQHATQPLACRLGRPSAGLRYWRYMSARVPLSCMTWKVP